MARTYIIAEAGVKHNRSLELAFRLGDEAKAPRAITGFAADAGRFKGPGRRTAGLKRTSCTTGSSRR